MTTNSNDNKAKKRDFKDDYLDRLQEGANMFRSNVAPFGDDTGANQRKPGPSIPDIPDSPEVTRFPGSAVVQ